MLRRATLYPRTHNSYFRWPPSRKKTTTATRTMTMMKGKQSLEGNASPNLSSATTKPLKSHHLKCQKRIRVSLLSLVTMHTSNILKHRAGEFSSSRTQRKSLNSDRKAKPSRIKRPRAYRNRSPTSFSRRISRRRRTLYSTVGGSWLATGPTAKYIKGLTKAMGSCSLSKAFSSRSSLSK
jgi:hypothetical protein